MACVCDVLSCVILFSRACKQVISYHGISRQRWSARWDAHVVDLSKNVSLYLGSFDAREKAARAHDVAFLKINGENLAPDVIESSLNFAAADYAELQGAHVHTHTYINTTYAHLRAASLTASCARSFVRLDVPPGIADVSADAIVSALRRESEDGSAMKASKFRGVYRSSNGSEWEARIGHDSPLVPWRPSSTASSAARREKSQAQAQQQRRMGNYGAPGMVAGASVAMHLGSEDGGAGPAAGFQQSMSRVYRNDA